MRRRLRLAVLVSGRGTNLEALLAAARDGRLDADIIRVVSNRAGVPALAIARAAGVEAVVLPSAGVLREEHDARVAEAIDAVEPDLVLLAGYMRILGGAFIARYAGRLLNIHPSLLPAFPGLDAQGQAHARGVRIAGCTTHLVTQAVDAGPIIAQAALAVDPAWTVDELRDAIRGLEHKLYPHTVQLFATGRARIDGDRVLVDGKVAMLEGA